MIPIKMPAGTTNVVTMRRPAAPKLAKIERIAIAGINVSPNPLRPLDGEEVKRLAVSMKRIGLMTPITVRYHEPTTDGAPDDSYEIIAGRHRHAAAISLGWDEIDAIEIECSDIDAKLWEIAENQHRAELTKLQHDKQVAEWIRLTDVAQLEPHQKAGQQPGGVRAAARDLGVDRNAAHRAVKVASLSDEAKAAAREHGLDDNRSALLAAVCESDPEDQVAKIVELAVKKTKPKPVYSKKETAAREKAREARFDKDNLKAAKSITESFIAAGKMSDQQIADFRERGIIPPFRLFSPCGMAFDGGPAFGGEPDAERSCNPTPVDDEPKPGNEAEPDLDDDPEEAARTDRLHEISRKRKRSSKGITPIEKDEHAFIERAIGVAYRSHDNPDDLIVTDEVLEAATCAADAWAHVVTELKSRSPTSQ